MNISIVQAVTGLVSGICAWFSFCYGVKIERRRCISICSDALRRGSFSPTARRILELRIDFDRFLG